MASQKELEWWNKFSKIMEKQWRLTSELNCVIRNEYYRDYQDFILGSGGSVLDVGCGTGWLSQYLAKNGMSVDGVDFSSEQLERARKSASEQAITGIEYFRRDLVTEPLRGRFDTYDSVIVNAVLHHLSREEIAAVIAKISLLLREGGRLYIYEPLVPRMENRPKYLVLGVMDFLVRLSLFSLDKMVALFGWLDSEYEAAVKEGYTGVSPDEKPIEFDDLRKTCEEHNLRLVAAIPFHNYSIIYGMKVMRAAEPYRTYLGRFARLFVALDKFVFVRLGWNNLSPRNLRSILCGAKFVKASQ